MLRRSLALVVLAALALSGAACRKSDARRAAEERAALQKELGGSYTIIPYRLLKLAVRAEGRPDAPPEIQGIVDPASRSGELTRRGDVGGDAQAVARMAVLAWEVRSLLDRHDEDEFPLLWSRFIGEAPPAWYDNGTEHLAFAFVEGVAQMTASNGKDTSLLTFAAYELSRAEPQPTWPKGQRLVARLERGLLFAGNHRHYAADEELTAYLAELDEGTARLLLAEIPGQKNPLLALRGAGRLARGWNRLEMDREQPGLDDLDAGLKDLEGAGIENELTLWTWATVHARRGRPADAAACIDRLAESPYLEESVRAELRDSAAALRSSGKLPGKLQQGRALYLVTRALVARGGGVEKIAARVVGPERAHRLVTPFDELVALQARVASAGDPKRLAGEAKALGAKLFQDVKDRVGEGGEGEKPRPE